MAIPKLKVYRLDEDFVETDDANDIQSLSSDELVPIHKKNLNVFDTEQMVGVKQHGQSRMVIQSGWHIMSLPLDRTDITRMYTIPVNCDGWVTSKGNFRVFAKVKLRSTDSSSESQSSLSSETSSVATDEYTAEQNELFNLCTSQNNWLEIDRKYWDYDISTTKLYGQYVPAYTSISNSCYINGTYYEYDGINPILVTEKSWVQYTTQSVGTSQIHQIDKIQFKLGQMLVHAKKYYATGNGAANYEQYIPLITKTSDQQECPNMIIIMYKKYYEFFDINNSNIFNQSVQTQDSFKQKYDSSTYVSRGITSNYSRYRVPFGQIYNGNKQGRCLSYKIGANNTILYSTQIPDNGVKNESNMSYYQGNYFYKRKILPLKYLVAQQISNSSSQESSSSEIDSYFYADSIIDSSGSCKFNADYDWYADGIMKPVLMQLLTVDRDTIHQRKIFKQLQLQKQAKLVLSYEKDEQNNEVPVYKVSLLDDYYSSKIYPKQIFLFYNTYEDTIGNIFDFNYSYANFNTSKINTYQDNLSFNSYGYENRGNLISNYSYADRLFKRDNSLSSYSYAMYQKKQKLAVVNVPDQFGYDANRDLVLNIVDSDTISFQIPDEMNFTDELGLKIYINGKKIWELSWQYTLNNWISNTTYNSNYDVVYTPKTDDNLTKFTIIKRENTNAVFSKDLMLVYHEKHLFYPRAKKLKNYDGTYFDSDKNPYCLGYRIPCYEKVKTTDLFVSSFPNWVQGHLNNDLDIFVGNTTYSGTNTSGQDTSGIYPAFQQDGWYAMYPQGSVQFNEDITVLDYFDLFNFTVQLVSNITISDSDWDAIEDAMPNYYSDVKKFALYYQKVRYNVAYYDGIYAVVRGKLSNYSIQNGGASYALLQDDDFLDSIDKKWILKDDNYLRLIYESGMKQLPQVLSSQQSGDDKQLATLLSQESILDTKCYFYKVDLSTDRINVISYMPTWASQNYGLIICLNPSNQYNQVVEFQDLTDDDIRIHITVDSNKNVLKIGKQNNSTYLSGQAPIDTYTSNIAQLFSNNLPVDWVELPPMQDSYFDYDISQVQGLQKCNDITYDDDSSSVPDFELLKRYKYSNENWYFDVYFQIISYRYSNYQQYNGDENSISKIQFAVYRVLK